MSILYFLPNWLCYISRQWFCWCCFCRCSSKLVAYNVFWQLKSPGKSPTRMRRKTCFCMVTWTKWRSKGEGWYFHQRANCQMTLTSITAEWATERSINQMRTRLVWRCARTSLWELMAHQMVQKTRKRQVTLLTTLLACCDKRISTPLYLHGY